MLLRDCKCSLKRLRDTLYDPTYRASCTPAPGASHGLLDASLVLGRLRGSEARPPVHRHHTIGTLLATDRASSVSGGSGMKCLACGAEMRLIDVRTEATTPFGIERRIFQCSSCRQSAQRLGFDRTRMPSPAITLSNAPAIRLQRGSDTATSTAANAVEIGSTPKLPPLKPQRPVD